MLAMITFLIIKIGELMVTIIFMLGSDKEFSKQLEHVLKGVIHDCNEVRVMALEKLKQLLKQNKVKLTRSKALLSS